MYATLASEIVEPTKSPTTVHVSTTARNCVLFIRQTFKIHKSFHPCTDELKQLYDDSATTETKFRRLTLMAGELTIRSISRKALRLGIA